MTMAKALTNGSQPMGTVAVKDELYDTIIGAIPDAAIEFFHGSTYSGHPSACAAGITTQQIYQDKTFSKRQQLCQITSWTLSSRQKTSTLSLTSAA